MGCTESFFWVILCEACNTRLSEYSEGDAGYSTNHVNALGDGDDKGKGNGKYLDVYSNEVGSKADIMGTSEVNTGRNNNLKVNHYGKNNEYSSGNIDSGEGYTPQQ